MLTVFLLMSVPLSEDVRWGAGGAGPPCRFSGEGREMCPRKPPSRWVPRSPASCISGVKTCEDATRNGFLCPCLGLALCGHPVAIVYLLWQQLGHLMGRGDLILCREGEWEKHRPPRMRLSFLPPSLWSSGFATVSLHFSPACIHAFASIFCWLIK